MPGCPQMKTGRTTATCRSSSGNWAGVTVTEACICGQGTFRPARPSREYSDRAPGYGALIALLESPVRIRKQPHPAEIINIDRKL